MRSALIALGIPIFLAPQVSLGQTEPTEAPKPMPYDGAGEFGLFGGIHIFPERHELYEVGKSPQKPLNTVAPNLGVRVGFFPWRFVGLEGEAALIPTAADDDSAQALAFNLRGHLVGQYPGRLTPFVVAGAGALGISSGGLGEDVDGEFHYGLGAKFYATKAVQLRLDGRHILAAKNDPQGESGGIASHFEVLAGIGLVLNPPPDPPPPPPDTDGDGVADPADKCPEVKSEEPDGCPPPDTDGDGVLDRDDQCKEVASKEPNGCPPPDTDGDGVIDRDDKCADVKGTMADGCPDPDPDKDTVNVGDDRCPEQAGVAPHGCPDADGDGVFDANDQCVSEPETKNGFQDADGCPDELPKAVQKFTGAIQGITFKSGSANISPSSFGTLQKAAQVLKEFAELRMEISGHTDDRGAPETNRQLSQERAEAVKAYFVAQGIDAARLEAKGYGPDQPAADNKTAAGREKNRRIEFKLIQ